MNNFIARIFSGLLSFLHALVALILVIGGLLNIFFFKYDISAIWGRNLFTTILIFGLFFFIYVIVVGFLATVVSINDNLNAIKLILSSTPSQPEIPTLSRSPQETANRLEPRV